MLRDVRTGSALADPIGLYMSDERSSAAGPWVMLNMIVSIDGATTVAGRSRGLGDDDDRLVFQAIRSVPDVILVGASTVQAEDYGPVVLDDRHSQARVDSGLDPAPRLVILSGSLSLDPSARVFADPDHRPTVLTRPGADTARLRALAEVADIVEASDLSGRTLIDLLGSARVVLCEGGPTLNGQLVAAGIVDEVNLTVAPMLVAGDSARMAHGEAGTPSSDMRLERMLLGDRSLFLRFVSQ